MKVHQDELDDLDPTPRVAFAFLVFVFMVVIMLVVVAYAIISWYLVQLGVI